MGFTNASAIASAFKSNAVRWGRHQPQNLTREMIQYV